MWNRMILEINMNPDEIDIIQNCKKEFKNYSEGFVSYG
jgi:hypothetical protein